MMASPTVSIVLPAYRADDTLGDAIGSVLRQDFQDWELVIVNERSDRPLASYEWWSSDPRIRVLQPDAPRGLAVALNLGIAAASARYIARMDADDVMRPARLSRQLAALQKRRLAFCGSGAAMFGAEAGAIMNPETGQNIIDTLLMGNPFVHPTVMFDRERVPGGLLYNPAFLCEEDYELWARICEPDTCGNIREILLDYRVAPEGNSNHPAKRVMKRKAIAAFAERMGVLQHVPLDALVEFQISGFVSAPDHAALSAYAVLAQRESLPKLGFMQTPLLRHRSYAAFFAWLNAELRIGPWCN